MKNRKKIVEEEWDDIREEEEKIMEREEKSRERVKELMIKGVETLGGCMRNNIRMERNSQKSEMKILDRRTIMMESMMMMRRRRRRRK